MKCKDCKYYEKQKSMSGIKGLGLCTKIDLLWEATEWGDGLDGRKLKESHKYDKAFVQDGSDYTATLHCFDDFGCVMFEGDSDEI